MFKKVLMSVIIWTVGSLLTTLLFFVMLILTAVTFPFDKQRRIVHAQCFWWCDAIDALNPYWDIHVSGLENIDKSRTYVIVSNHQSLADIVIMYKTKAQFKWVAKESLFKIPVLGWNLALAKHIRISRGKFSSIKQVYRDAATWLRHGMSVLFFPEGTRSETNEMRDFQNGAFKLALKEKVPILPIILEGTGNAIPKGSWIFTTKTTCGIKVLPPIETTDFSVADFDKLKNLARSKMSGSA